MGVRMRSRGRAAVAGALAAAALASCGSDDTPSSRLVDPDKPPLVNALDLDPADGSLVMTTNRGMFRIDREGREARRVTGEVRDRRGRSPVGTFLAFAFTGRDRLIGSGHPDDKRSKLPEYLGLLRSDDGARRWEVVSRLGLADLHVIRPIHDRIYAYDAVLGGMLIGESDGRRWTERATPPGLMIDFVVDPEDPDYLVSATEESTFRSDDRARTWRPLEPGPSARLAWPARTALYRAEKDGRFRVSDDRGESWRDVGRIDGEPWRLKAVSPSRVFAALSDGSIHETRDGGRSWRELFAP